MQLASTDEIVMVSGAPPVLAKKLRYFEDRNFTRRVLPAAAVEWRWDRAPENWTGKVAAPVAADLGEQHAETDGLSLKLTQEPEHELEAEPAPLVPEPDVSAGIEEAADPSDDRILETVRRAVAADRGDPGFLPEF